MNGPSSVANVRTPDLARALADYTGAMGFDCQQHVPGVFARLRHGPLCVQLWACGAAPGRFEKPSAAQRPFEPAHLRVEVAGLHALHRRLRDAVRSPADGRTERLEAQAPEWQPWGAWEARLRDVDGNVLHLIDRAAWRPDASRSPPPPTSQRATP